MAFVEYYRVVGELPCLAYASRLVSSLSQGTISSIGLSEGIPFSVNTESCLVAYTWLQEASRMRALVSLSVVFCIFCPSSEVR